MSQERPTPQRAGRRPRTESQVAAVRENIVRATATAFAERGSHDLHVAAVLAAARISRATFYRFFPNVSEPLELAIAGALDDLTQRVGAAARERQDLPVMVAACIDAYLGWCRDNRGMVGVIHAEKFDPTSPVYAHHERTMQAVLAQLSRDFADVLGRPVDAFGLDILLMTVEYTAVQVFARTNADDAALDWARSLLVDVALASMRHARVESPA